MQKPSRIVVFGVLSILYGFGAGLVNIEALQLGLSGADALPEQSFEGSGQMMQMMREMAQAQRAALDSPVYRVMTGVKGAAGMGLGVLLITAGIGLLRERLWSLKAARLWAFSAMALSVVAVTLQMRYVMPNTTTASQGGMSFGALMSLGLMWLFPLLILKVLCRPVVADYLAHRESHGTTPQPRTMAHASNQPPTQSSGQPPAGHTPAPRPGTSAGDQAAYPTDTWRDDPWNDPGR